MSKQFSPMLAETPDDLSALRYPLMASYKMDGIRAIIMPEGPRTRSMKPVPNAHISSMLATLPVGLDGELAVVREGAIDFRATSSSVMNRKFTPEFRYFVFDYIPMEASRLQPYDRRWSDLCRLRYTEALPDWVVTVEQRTVVDADHVREMFAEALDKGHEGLILRSASAGYKSGRSTVREQGMLKVKPWADTEATIVDVLPEFHNSNPAFESEVGRTKRSTAQAGMVQKESMGQLVVRDPRWPKDFEIGTGFTAEERAHMWMQRENLKGKLARFSYITAGGYDVPRHCSFRGIRDPRDMS